MTERTRVSGNARDGNGTRRARGASGAMELPPGTRIDRYVIDSMIAAGGFGITYVARHETLGRLHALKEHFPRQFAFRDQTTYEVQPSDPQTYEWALDRFLREGKSLADCRHPNVVEVTDVFEANGTAYMALGYERGTSLKGWMNRLGRPPSQTEIDRWLGALLDALEHVHGKGMMHRDIAPDNIMIRENGSPCLIDFGAARQAIAERSQMLSAIVKGGYSPPEQYSTRGRDQGPWSDIYALAATLYHVVTGDAPTEATVRILDDDVKPLAGRRELRNYRPDFLAAIDRGLSLRQALRPRSIAEWRAELMADASDSRERNRGRPVEPPPPPRAPPPAPSGTAPWAAQKPQPPPPPPKNEPPRRNEPPPPPPAAPNEGGVSFDDLPSPSSKTSRRTIPIGKVIVALLLGLAAIAAAAYLKPNWSSPPPRSAAATPASRPAIAAQSSAYPPFAAERGPATPPPVAAQAPASPPEQQGAAPQQASDPEWIRTLPVQLSAPDVRRFAEFDAWRRQSIVDAQTSTDAKDKADLQRVLAGDPVAFSNQEILGNWRCRTLKLGGNLGTLTIYGFFQCRIYADPKGTLIFQKTTGSQRTKGALYRVAGDRMAYIGASTVNDDPLRNYGDDSKEDEVALLFKAAQGRFRLEFPSPYYESTFNIIELVR